MPFWLGGVSACTVSTSMLSRFLVSWSVLIIAEQRMCRRSLITLSLYDHDFDVLEYYATVLTYSDHQTRTFLLGLRLGWG